MHGVYNWLHNITHTFTVFFSQIIGYVAAVPTHVFLLSLRALQDVGVLPQPGECQLFSSEDCSRAETSESHQPSAK